MPDYTVITFTTQAPPDTRWTAKAFNSVVGSTVPLTDHEGRAIGTAILTTVLVAPDGRSARFTIATEDTVGLMILLPETLNTKDQT